MHYKVSNFHYDRSELDGSAPLRRGGDGRRHDLARTVVRPHVSVGHRRQSGYAERRDGENPEENVAALHRPIPPRPLADVRSLALHCRRSRRYDASLKRYLDLARFHPPDHCRTMDVERASASMGLERIPDLGRIQSRAIHRLCVDPRGVHVILPISEVKSPRSCGGFCFIHMVTTLFRDRPANRSRKH